MCILFSAVRHLKKYVILFAAFTTNMKSELHLLNKIQEYCYDNMNFIKSFNKIVLLLYKSKFRFFLLISSRKWFAYLQRSKFLKRYCNYCLLICSWRSVWGCHFEVVQGNAFLAWLVRLHGSNEKICRLVGTSRRRR